VQIINIVFQRIFSFDLWRQSLRGPLLLAGSNVGWPELASQLFRNDYESHMTEFQRVAKVGDIPEGQGRSFAVNGTMVGVFLSQGKYLAINDFCPHMGASLADGHVEGDTVMCPWHAWRFSLTDGTWLDNSRSKIKSACYDVRIEGDEIQVSVPRPTDST